MKSSLPERYKLPGERKVQIEAVQSHKFYFCT